MTRPLFYTGKSPEAEKSRKYKELYEQHGHKIFLPKEQLEEEDRSLKWRGRLRCFKMRLVRDEMGVKTGEKVRCKNPTAKGSLFCKKHHGGNVTALVHGKQVSQYLYKGAFQNKIGSLFDMFMNDPSYLDIKPEFIALRTILVSYIKKLSNEEPIRNPKKLLKIVYNITRQDMYTPQEKWSLILELVHSQNTLMDGENIDRISKITDTLSKVIERVRRYQTKDEFILTPEGIKILLRSLIEVMKVHVPPEKIEIIKQALLDISIRTQGDLSKLTEGRDIETRPLSEKNSQE
jgi:hypothetical protein